MIIGVLAGCNQTASVQLSTVPSVAADLQGAGKYNRGDQVTVRALAKEGWEFVNWTQGEEVVAETGEFTFIIEESISLVANFKPLEYSISVLAQGPGSLESSLGPALYGNPYTLIALPDEGCRFAGWLEGEEIVSRGKEYSFLPDGDRELVALFLAQLALEYDESIGSVEESLLFQPTPTVVLAATPIEGYEFFDWIDKNNGQEIKAGAEYSFPAAESKNLLVRFRKRLTNSDGNSLIAVVGKETTIGKYTPQDLVKLPTGLSKKGRFVRKQVAEALAIMAEDARADGVRINVDSGYRSYNTQVDLFNRYAKRDGVLAAERYSARAGQSEHQLGTVVDFGGTNRDYTASFAETDQGKWLLDHAYKYGFALSYPQGKEAITGYKYEPWHYRFIGIDLAREWKDSNLTLIEFLKLKNQAY